MIVLDIDLKKLQEKELEILNEFARVCNKLNLRFFLSSGTTIGAVRHKGFIPWDDDVDVIMPWNDYKKFLKYGQKEIDSKFFIQSNFSDLWYREFSKVRMNGTTAIEKSYEDIHFHQGVWIDIFPVIGVKDDKKWIEKFNRYIKFRDLFVQDLFFEKTETLSAPLKLLKKVPLGLRRAMIKFMDLFFMKNPSKRECGTHLWGFGITQYYDSRFFEESVSADFEGYTFPVPKEYDEYMTQMYGDYMTPPPEEDRVNKHSFAILDLEKDYKEYLK